MIDFAVIQSGNVLNYRMLNMFVVINLQFSTQGFQIFELLFYGNFILFVLLVFYSYRVSKNLMLRHVNNNTNLLYLVGMMTIRIVRKA